MRVLFLATAILLLANYTASAESGQASIYSTTDKDQTGTVVACPGRKLVDSALTAAHRTLRCGTLVSVKNTATGLSVVVTITDRGPYVKGRIVDLTRAAGRAIRCPGLCPVILTKT